MTHDVEADVGGDCDVGDDCDVMSVEQGGSSIIVWADSCFVSILFV